VHNFVTQPECDALLETLSTSPSQPSDTRSAELSQEDRRTSVTVFPDADDLCWLRERVAEVTNVCQPQLEPTKLTHYSHGALFRKHTDASFLIEKLWAFAARAADVHEDDVQSACSWPSRFVTLFLYLNDVSTGGRTRFRWLDGADSIPGHGVFAQAIEPFTATDNVELSIVPRAGKPAGIEPYESSSSHLPCRYLPCRHAYPAGMAVIHFPTTTLESGCVPDPRTMHESEPAVDPKSIVQQFIWPLPITPDCCAVHAAVRSEWDALLVQAGAMRQGRAHSPAERGMRPPPSPVAA
jgi:hypothetical protein